MTDTEARQLKKGDVITYHGTAAEESGDHYMTVRYVEDYKEELLIYVREGNSNTFWVYPEDVTRTNVRLH